jgi:hypothetical protein
MSYCSHCGSPNKASSKFCNNCGALLSAAFDVRCAICGSANKLEGVFCSTCGGRLEAGPAVLTDRVDTIAPIPNPSRSPRADQAQIAGANEGTDAGVSSPDPQGLGRRRPEWTERLRPTNLTRPGPPSTPPPEIEGDFPPWLRELGATDGPPEGGDDADFESRADWLTKLRAAAVIEPEPTKADSAASAADTEPTPVPQWFANIRPQVIASPPEPSPFPAKVGEQQPAARPAEEYGFSKGESKGESRGASDPSTTKNQFDGFPEALPEWLVQLQSLPLPSGQDLMSTVPAGPASTPVPTAEEKPKGREELPEWLSALATERDEQQAVATVQVAMSPSPVTETEQPPATEPESQVGFEIPLTPEEESALPDWLAAPIEPEALLAKLEETRAESPAQETESQGRAVKSAAEEITLGVQAENRVGQQAAPTGRGGGMSRQVEPSSKGRVPVEANMPPSRLARMVDGMQGWLQGLWRRSSQTNLPQASPGNSTSYQDELPAWLKQIPVPAPAVEAASPEPASGQEDSDLCARLSMERPRLIEVNAELPEPDMLAAWPLPEDFPLDQPVVADEILEPPVSDDSPVSQVISESTNEQPPLERRLTDQAIVEKKIIAVTVPAQPAVEQSDAG